MMDSEVGVMSSLAGGHQARNAGASRSWEGRGNVLPRSLWKELALPTFPMTFPVRPMSDSHL